VDAASYKRAVESRLESARELLGSEIVLASSARVLGGAKGVGSYPKHSRVAKIGAALALAPEPVTTVVGVSMIALAATAREKTGREIAKLSEEFWTCINAGLSD
jgi:hypothetical protein